MGKLLRLKCLYQVKSMDDSWGVCQTERNCISVLPYQSIRWHNVQRQAEAIFNDNLASVSWAVDRSESCHTCCIHHSSRIQRKNHDGLVAIYLCLLFSRTNWTTDQRPDLFFDSIVYSNVIKVDDFRQFGERLNQFHSDNGASVMHQNCYTVTVSTLLQKKLNSDLWLSFRTDWNFLQWVTHWL